MEAPLQSSYGVAESLYSAALRDPRGHSIMENRAFRVMPLGRRTRRRRRQGALCRWQWCKAIPLKYPFLGGLFAFFFGFVAAKPPLARPVAGRSRSAAVSHRVIIFPGRVDGVPRRCRWPMEPGI